MCSRTAEAVLDYSNDEWMILAMPRATVKRAPGLELILDPCNYAAEVVNVLDVQNILSLFEFAIWFVQVWSHMVACTRSGTMI